MMKLFSMLWGAVAAYAEMALASKAQGFLGFLGVGKETTWGTAVAASDYAEFMSENLSVEINRFPTRNAFAKFYNPDDYAGARRIAGDIVTAGHPLILGLLLKGAMQTVSGSVVASGFLWNSRFVTTQSEFSADAAAQPYTFEVHRDVTSSHRYSGCVISQLQLNLAPNQDLRLTAGIIGKSASLISKSTPTFVTSPSDPFTFDTASISIGGSANSRLEALTVTVRNNIDGILRLNNSNEIAAVRRTAPQEVRIGGTIEFIDVTEYLDFINQTERAFKVSLTRANSFQFIIDAPRFVYHTFPTGVPGRDRLTVSFEGEARFHSSSNVAIDFGLTTTKSNW